VGKELPLKEHPSHVISRKDLDIILPTLKLNFIKTLELNSKFDIQSIVHFGLGHYTC
jgi:hypothetical protein